MNAPASILAAFLFAAQPALAQTEPELSTLSFTATGRAPAAPDEAVLAFQVENHAPTALEATRLTATEMDAVIAALRARGVGNDDIETAGLVVNRRERDPRNGEREVYFVAENTIRVTDRRLDRLGPIFDAAFGAGADEFLNIRFQRRDSAALVSEARRLAMQDLQKIAREYAEAGGWRSMRLRQVSEMNRNVSGLVVTGSRIARAAPTTPILPSEGEVTVTLSATYSFEP